MSGPGQCLERFNLVLLCDACFKPIEGLDGASLLWKADKAWGEEGDTPDVLCCDRCLDERFRERRFKYADRGLVRIKPLAEMLEPLVEALGGHP